MGRPIVTTDVPGCREIVEDQITGFLCKSGDYLDLAAKLEMMIKLSHARTEKLWALKVGQRSRRSLISQ